MNPKFLWQLPSHGLTHQNGSWFAYADRTLGDGAWGLLAPVRENGARWDIAAGDAGVLDLVPLQVTVPRELPMPARPADASHYVCMLRYDHPHDRPGSTFGLTGALAVQPREQITVDGQARERDKVLVGELRAALQVLQQHYGEDFERQLITADTPALRDAKAGFAASASAPATAASMPGERFCFAFASCQFPAGMMDRRQANASYRSIARRFARLKRLPTRLLLLGDQVYTDATYGLLDPVRMDDRYRTPYEELAARDGPLGQLPQDFQRVIRMTPDDHEIVDDWEPARHPAMDEKYRCGVAAYWRYQRGGQKPDPAEIWMKESGGGTPGWRLFMADTRTAREKRTETNVQSARILGPEQTHQLEQWLREAPPEDLKIVTSAAMLLPRTLWHVDEPLYLDNWQGYPASLHSLLALLCDREMRNVVFLSGDAHLACNARITVREPASGRECVFTSHHAPPLYAPYPFANESRWNLLREEEFPFEWKDQGGTRHYTCRVEARFPSETTQGYALLHAKRAGGDWKLKVKVVNSR